MRDGKVLSMGEAVAEYVHDGDTVALEGFGHLIPFAAGHEIIRQGRRDLTLCRMTPDLIADQLIAAGCVSKLVASFFASGSAGSLYEIRRRVEAHDPEPLELEEYSHYGMFCRYQAGASGLPFFPLRSYAGSDIPALNPKIRLVESPYGEGGVYVVPPLKPDVTIVQAQRADRLGNVQIWGILGAQQEAVFAAKHAIVVVEEVVDETTIRDDPNRTIIPSHAVDAVVCCPGGTHPSYAQGYNNRDGAFYREWTAISKDRTVLRQWLDDWVYGVPDREAYLAKLGPQRRRTVAVAERLSGQVDYGRRLG
ncbi:CoA transferase subunit A [Amycolatopsis palatopharyngis]|uniref:CoA transferase subunit A n=1 Tax=Amycolatopsis palatopharyngis TaxID=187982 RepID=UPI000E245FA7|nr:CoA-transferase [Amycolatopsis palatopharyngis]